MSELRELFKEIIPKRDITLQQILNNLLDSENIELKTHIHKPLNLAILKLISDYIRLSGYKEPSELLDNFILIFLKYMVSYKRLSRTEIIKAITNQLPSKDDLSNTQKLIAPIV